MNRSDLQRLAHIRLHEAGVLLRNDCPDGAYYLAGLAVECGLKACIARRTRRYDFPDKREVNQSHTHDLKKLLYLTELEPHLQRSSPRYQVLQANWNVVKDWRVESRYNEITMARARDIYQAVADQPNGVLAWLQEHW